MAKVGNSRAFVTARGRDLANFGQRGLRSSPIEVRSFRPMLLFVLGPDAGRRASLRSHGGKHTGSPVELQ
ncbi:MAG: hypothetical protein B6A08_01370 [Sorangiineae bacterium NIC37A_2]|nr:MAG: hypothetical protein B6A08_01370 [Sorangiineae bacterium NIC37A_2]